MILLDIEIELIICLTEVIHLHLILTLVFYTVVHVILNDFYYINSKVLDVSKQMYIYLNTIIKSEFEIN